ncbi:MAG: DUF349 domain-containing protein, partial [Bacteroidia bacterium]|nr:DUF349 domain-containing protein [Bacteroidia bacterium]
MTELNEVNPSEAALNAEATELTNVENTTTENVVIESTIVEPELNVEPTIVEEIAIPEDVVIESTVIEPTASVDPINVEETNTEKQVETNASLVTDSIEIALDEHEIDADLAAIEHHELAEQLDYVNKTKDELLAIALQAMSDKPHSEALQIFKDIKPHFDAALNEEQNAALQKFIEEGGEKDDFEYRAGVTARDTFNKAIKDLRDKISVAKAIAEAERVKNLRAKENILDQIKALNSSEETKESLTKLKELQTEWKKIKNVPKEHVERLWESYRVLNEIFYDKLSIDNEIAQLDRERNLDAKIDLCKKVSELAEEKSIKSALIAVKKYQEDWRNIGPVPKEANEEIWTRFKAEVDKIFASIKAETEKNEAVRQANLVLKLALIEKSKDLATYATTRIKDWMEKTKEANELMEEW